MNISIQPIKTFVKKQFLYDGDKDKKDHSCSGTIIGVSAYEGFPLSFHVMIEDQYLYSDLPVQALIHKNGSTVEFDAVDLYSILCPKKEVENFIFDSFKDKEVSVYFKGKKQWLNGIYLTSFDFYTDNYSLHLIKVHTGHFALVPNHKINWNCKHELADFKKSNLDHRKNL